MHSIRLSLLWNVRWMILCSCIKCMSPNHLKQKEHVSDTKLVVYKQLKWNGYGIYGQFPVHTGDSSVGCVVWWWCTIPYYTILWCTILWVADVTWIDYQITSGHSHYWLRPTATGLLSPLGFCFCFQDGFHTHLVPTISCVTINWEYQQQAGVGAGLGFQNENAFIALELSSFSLQYLSNVWLVIVLFQIRIQDSFWYWVFAP